jgi:hypothetical protein
MRVVNASSNENDISIQLDDQESELHYLNCP